MKWPSRGPSRWTSEERSQRGQVVRYGVVLFGWGHVSE